MQCKMMTTLPTPPRPPTYSRTPPNRHDGMYHCTQGHSGMLYICALWSLNKTTSKKIYKMAARNDFHWLRFLPIGVYRIWQSASFALRRSLSSFTKSVHSKSYGAPKICDLLSSLWFLLFSQSWLWLAPSALSELGYTNTSGVREFKTVWNFPSLSH